MPELNYLAIAVAAIVPSILGALYYGPLFGKQWLSSLGKTEAEMVPNNAGLTYGLALLMAGIVSFILKLNIELTHKEVSDAGELAFGSFHTFQHGALHGAMTGAMLVVPVLISFSLFHKMSGKNIMLNSIFWILCFAVMGGILDAWN